MSLPNPGFVLDVTQRSCVIVCRECGWRAGTLDRYAAWVLAHEHDLTAHPGRGIEIQAIALEKLRRRRRAGWNLPRRERSARIVGMWDSETRST